MLPFSDVDFFIHTNRALASDKTLSADAGLRRVQVIVHNLSNYLYLGWSTRYYINATWHDYDIVMFLEDDILVSAQGILDYWCQFKDRSFSQGRSLSFIRYEFSLRQEKTYAQGYMAFVSSEARWEIDRKNNCPYSIGADSPTCPCGSWTGKKCRTLFRANSSSMRSTPAQAVIIQDCIRKMPSVECPLFSQM